MKRPLLSAALVLITFLSPQAFAKKHKDTGKASSKTSEKKKKHKNKAKKTALVSTTAVRPA